MKIPLLSRVKSFGSKRHSSSSTTKSDTATTSNNSNKPVAPPQQQQTREQQQQAIKMGGSDQFLALAKARRSIYTLSKESTIPDSKIEEIVQEAVKWSPSTYNVQSARAVILFGDEHDKLWEIVRKHMDQVPMDEGMKGYIMGRIAGWKGSYGTVMWFEDQVALDALGDKNPMVKPMLTECEYYLPISPEGRDVLTAPVLACSLTYVLGSDHSTGIHQFVGKFFLSNPFP